mmetsp:Transcript_1393/g.4018  ORF Transcript_1393/g.4018 Transcript_1393/m.4018 type:complete len:846 (-) Transcript_1393:186-2723(-)
MSTLPRPGLVHGTTRHPASPAGPSVSRPTASSALHPSWKAAALRPAACRAGGRKLSSRQQPPLQHFGFRQPRRSPTTAPQGGGEASSSSRSSASPIVDPDDSWRDVPADKRRSSKSYGSVQKTIDIDEVSEAIGEFEALWKRSTDEVNGDKSGSSSSTSFDEDLERDAGAASSRTSRQGSGSNSELCSVSVLLKDSNSFEEDFTANGSTSNRSERLPSPLYLLSIQMRPDEVDNHAYRRDVISKSFKSGLVNAVMLEDSELPSKILMKPASMLREVCNDLGLIFVVENRVDVAANAHADGVVLDQGLDLESTRTFLDLSMAKDKATSHNTVVEADGAVAPPGVLCGRVVSDGRQALEAEEENVDFVMVMPPEKCSDEGDLRMELRAIRRATTAHVVASHSYCLEAGGPKLVIGAGADGLQIPAAKLYKMMNDQLSMESVKELPPTGRVIGATLLIAGGTVGAGIIALPIKTAAAGFIPSMAAMAGCWVFMVTTACLLLELSLWFGPTANLTSMASKTLGPSAKTLVTGLYIFIYGATLTAYMAEGANFLNMALRAIGYTWPIWTVVTAFSATFGAVLLAGPNPTDKVNTVCLAIAIAAYVMLLQVAAGTVLIPNLLQANWGAAPAALPVMVVAFTFHNIVPSLLSYLGSSRRVMQAILAGSGLPFLMYFIWELVILGTISPDVKLTSASQIVDQLSAATGGRAAMSVNVFSCFAIITSFLGVGLGCVDFLKDLLMKEGGPFAGQVRPGSILETLIPLIVTLTPPLVVACAAPQIFYPALEFSGTFRLVLFAIIPVLMAWKGRYTDKLKPFVVGGKPMLAMVLLIAVTVLSVEWGGRLGLLTPLAA